MKRRKEDYIVLALAFALVVVVLGISLMIFFSPQQRDQQGKIIGRAPTAVPTPTTTIEATPAQELVPLGGGNMFYDATAGDKVADLAENRRVLSDEDIQAKDAVLQELFATEASGYVYTSPTIKIEYVNSADEFVIEITTTAIDGAKKEAVDWFLSKGFTNDGLCKIPILFYLNNDVAQSPELASQIFSPLVPGCK
jgi:hypothetical protein